MTEPCAVCGLPLEVGQFGCITTIRPHGLAKLRMIEDSIPGGLVVENMSATPQKFYSKSEYRDAMRAANLKQEIRHVPLPGSDKSPHTSRWI